MKERLTGRRDNGTAYLLNETTVRSHEEAIDRLAYYEDMEEQGRLVVLPCKQGTLVYAIVPDFSVSWPDPTEYKVIWDSFKLSHLRDFGKTVFLTREEAEQALTEKVYERVRDVVDKHNQEAMRKIAEFIEPTEGGAN